MALVEATTNRAGICSQLVILNFNQIKVLGSFTFQLSSIVTGVYIHNMCILCTYMCTKLELKEPELKQPELLKVGIFLLQQQVLLSDIFPESVEVV